MFRSRVKSKMNATRAFGIMGVTKKDLLSEQDNNNDPKESIDKALWHQMQVLSRKKMEALKEQKDREEQKKRQSRPLDSATGQQKPRRNKKSDGVENHKNSSSNPYLAKPVEFGPIKQPPRPVPGESSNKSEKYAEDVLALHEAYQYLMRKYVITPEGGERLNHSAETINKVNQAIGKKSSSDDQSAEGGDEKTLVHECRGHEDEGNTEEDDVEDLPRDVDGATILIPCGACALIKKLEDVEIS